MLNALPFMMVASLRQWLPGNLADFGARIQQEIGPSLSNAQYSSYEKRAIPCHTVGGGKDCLRVDVYKIGRLHCNADRIVLLLKNLAELASLPFHENHFHNEVAVIDVVDHLIDRELRNSADGLRLNFIFEVRRLFHQQVLTIVEALGID